MTSLIFALWSIGFAAKALAVFVLWRRGLASRFQSLTALLIVLTAQTVIAAALSHDMQAYTRAYALIAWASILFEGFAITGVFWILTEHYPRYRTAGSVLLAILSIAATAICWALGYIVPPPGWQGLWHSAIWAQRGMSAAMVVILLGARLFVPRVHSIPVAKSARRAADILTLHVTLALASAMVSVAGGPTLRYNAAASLIIVINGMLFGVLCAAFLTRESDVVVMRPASPSITEHEALSSALLWDGFRDFARMLSRR